MFLCSVLSSVLVVAIVVGGVGGVFMYLYMPPLFSNSNCLFIIYQRFCLMATCLMLECMTYTVSFSMVVVVVSIQNSFVHQSLPLNVSCRTVHKN